MSLLIPRSTTVTIQGTVLGGQIAGWSIQVVGVGPFASFSKSSADPTQVQIIDPVLGTFEFYLSTEDTAQQKNISIEVRAQDGNGGSYRMCQDVLQID